MAQQKPSGQFNSRKYQGKIERELLVGAILIAIIVGGGIIALLWGRDAFVAALGCLVLAVGLGGVIFLFLRFLEVVSKD